MSLARSGAGAVKRKDEWSGQEWCRGIMGWGWAVML